MTIALYMDVHVRRMITVGLRLRGIDVITAQEDGHRLAVDPVLLDRAAKLNRVIFTNDDDFLAEAQQRQIEGIDFVGIIYSHQRTPIGICVHDLELIAKVNIREDLANQITFVPF